MNMNNYRNKASSTINNYILPLGFFFFLTGILYFKSFSAYHTQIYLFLIIPVLLPLLVNREQFRPLLLSRSFQILVILLVYGMLSLLWNDPSTVDLKYFKRFFIILFFVLAIISMSIHHTERIVALLLLAAGIYSLAAYYSFYAVYVAHDTTLTDQVGRIIGIGNLSNPLLSSHIYGLFSALIMTYFFAIKRSWKKDIGLVLLFFGLIVFVLLTQSRTPLLALGAVLILLIWMHRNKLLFYFFLVLCGFALIYFTLNFEQLIARGLSFRPEIWSATLEKIINKPFLGSGVGTDVSIHIIYLEGVLTEFSDTHNIHLGLAYRLGLVGLFIWVSLIISLLLVYLNNKQSILAQIGIVLLVYGMSAGMTEGTSIFSRPKEIWFLIWLPIALLFVADYQRLAGSACLNKSSTSGKNSDQHETTS